MKSHDDLFEGCTDPARPTASNPVMQAGAGLEAANEGTLGCFATLVADPTKIIMLSAQHVLYNTVTDSGPGTAVGSPTIKSSWPCRTNVIAHVLDGVYNNLVDCAIAQLDAGVQRPYQQIFPGLGPDRNGQNKDRIVGIAPLKTIPGNPEQVSVAKSQHVRKIGVNGLSTGVVTDVTYTIDVPADDEEGLPGMQKQIIIEPLQDNVNKGSDGLDHFAKKGDSGAVVVDEDNQIIGLLIRKADFRKPGVTVPPWMGFGGVVTDIHRILGVFKARGREITIPSTLQSPGKPSVTTTRALMPGASIGMMSRPRGQELVQQQVLEQVKLEMRGFPLGAQIVTAIELNRPELVRLVHHQRRVKVAWHRAHGPELMARFAAGLEDFDQPIPSAVDGMTIDASLTAVQAALEAHGTPELVEDLRRLAPPLKAALSSSPTLRALIETLRRLEAHV